MTHAVPPPAVATRDSTPVPACDAVAATVAAADRRSDVAAALAARRGAAVTAWTGSVRGLRVTVVRDPAPADVHVRWAPDGATGTALAPITAGRTTTLVPDATPPLAGIRDVPTDRRGPRRGPRSRGAAGAVRAARRRPVRAAPIPGA